MWRHARTAAGGAALQPTDVVLVPEAHRDPFHYASAAFSPARAILVLMAAPGLFGWSFDGDGPPGDPMSVDPDSVARPEQLQAARHLGLELWTNLRAIADQARAHDIPHQYVAVGRP
jgi:hypothetical protein